MTWPCWDGVSGRPCWLLVAVAVGVAGLADVVDVPKCGGGDVGWDDQMLPGNWHRAWTPSQQDVDCQYVKLCGLCSYGGVWCGAGC